jgi:hypothetical protein
MTKEQKTKIKGGVLNCVCAKCGEELTAPYFHDGLTYGWTCIKYVNPGVKITPIKGIWVKCEIVEEGIGKYGKYVSVKFFNLDKVEKIAKLYYQKNIIGEKVIDSGSYFKACYVDNNVYMNIDKNYYINIMNKIKIKNIMSNERNRYEKFINNYFGETK